MNLQPLFMPMSVGLLLLAGTTPTLAQPSAEGTTQVPARNADKLRSPMIQVLFKPSRSGQPPTTRGAGSRNDRYCLQDTPTKGKPTLTALVPTNQSSLTWAERPTFWVYLPKTSARQIVLSVKEEGSQQHSQRFLPITGESGIIGVQFAKNSPPLEVGKSYQWAIVLVCGDRPSPNDPVVTAWVQRAAPSQPLNNQQAALEQAVRYGEQGIWYDALTTLAVARRSQSDNPALAKIWADFLAQPSVGLGAIANEPLR